MKLVLEISPAEVKQLQEKFLDAARSGQLKKRETYQGWLYKQMMGELPIFCGYRSYQWAVEKIVGPIVQEFCAKVEAPRLRETSHFSPAS